ncbi:MAG: hypothetical protein AB1461_11815 [Thermodesulfobacteriota bacterium]
MTKSFGKMMASVSICAMLLSGCATTGNLLNTADYTEEKVATPQTYFTKVRAAADDGDFRVSGRLRLKGQPGLDIPDLVEVALLDTDGTLIDSQKVPYYPRIMGGSKHSREARFVARFDQTPPPGTVIRVSNVN